MKKILLLLILFNFSISVAQVPEWSWAKSISVYTSGKQNSNVTDSDGNVYLVGDFNTDTATIGNTTLTNTSLTGFGDAYIFKFNKDGNLIWHKQISGINTEIIVALTTDDTGNLYIVGSAENDLQLGTTLLTAGYNGYFIAKLNSDGDFIWAIKGTGIEEFYYLRDIKVDQNGNVFVSGVSSSSTITFDEVSVAIDPESSSVSSTRPFIFKFNSSGIAQWGKFGIGSESTIWGSKTNSIAVDSNGAVIMCGEFHYNSLQFGTITLTKSIQNSDSFDLFIVKYDAAGNEVWAYNAGTTSFASSTFAAAVTTDLNNNVFLSGSFSNSIQLGSTNITTIGHQFFLAKYNPEGIVQWAKTPDYSNSYSVIKSLDTDSNGNVYAGGSTHSFSLSFSDIVQLPSLGTGGALFVAKYNNDGIAIWAKGINNVDPNNDISITCTSENDLAVGGTFSSASIQLGAITLTKANSSRDLFVGRLNASPLNTANFNPNAVVIYPNPVHDLLNISNNSFNNYEIYNALGSSVQKGSLNSESKLIDVSSLQTGLYLMIVTDLNGTNKHIKLIKQ